MLILAIVIYAAAMTAANLSVAHFGPASIPVNAFVLIGLDLTLRDWLQVRLKPWQLLALIGASGCITYGLNADAGRFAVASAAAFTLAALADWAVFVRIPGPWFTRSNGSNVAGALVDSLVFPAIAFGGLDQVLVAKMFAAKVLGGFVWSSLLATRVRS